MTDWHAGTTGALETGALLRALAGVLALIGVAVLVGTVEVAVGATLLVLAAGIAATGEIRRVTLARRTATPADDLA